MVKDCKKCGKPIHNITVDGRKILKKNRTTCFDCVPYGTSKYSGYNPDGSERNAISGEEFLAKRREISKRHYEKHRKDHGEIQQTARNRERKNFIVGVISGGKCQVCGYSKLASNLSFHHLHGKERALTRREFQSSVENVLTEVSKCVLLCHNCHGEVHGGLIDESILDGYNLIVRNSIKSFDWSLSWNDFLKKYSG